MKFKKGQIPWNKNTKGIMKKNSSSFKKGIYQGHGFKKGEHKSSKNEFKKGMIPWNKNSKGIIKAWNKGKKCPQISKGLTGKKLSKEHREKAIKNLIIPKKGLKYIGQFKKGQVPWNKDKIGVMPEPWNKLESRVPYPYEFNNNLKNRIRKRDSFECQLCFIKQEKLDERLIIHHIDFDKKNNSEFNLISLCRNCHGKVHCKNAIIWKQFFINLHEKKIEVKNGKLY